MDFGRIDLSTGTNFAGGQWQVIHDSGELGSAQTSYTISGLDGNTDVEYLIITRVVNGYSGSVYYQLRINNDSGTNYGYQQVQGYSTTVAAVRNTAQTEILALGKGAALNDLSMAKALLYSKKDYLRTCLIDQIEDVSGTTVSEIRSIGGVWNNTADNITSLVVVANQTNGIGVGSRIILLARRPLGSEATSGMQCGNVNVKGKLDKTWQLVERYEVTGSAITSYTFSGLDGNTDQIYLLKCRSILVDEHRLYINNDSANNYGFQRVTGQNTTIAANRNTATTTRLGGGTSGAGNRMTLSEHLIYAKSGYVRTALSQLSEDISGTTIDQASLYGQVWNNTSDNITSLVVSATTNGLSVGTVFELFKLNL